MRVVRIHQKRGVQMENKSSGVMFKVLTPIKSIRQKCLHCCCGQRSEAANCRIQSCALWPYRLGKRPTRENSKYEYKQTSNETIYHSHHSRRAYGDHAPPQLTTHGESRHGLPGEHNGPCLARSRAGSAPAVTRVHRQKAPACW